MKKSTKNLKIIGIDLHSDRFNYCIIEPGEEGKIPMAILRRVMAEIYLMLEKGEYHYFREEDKHLKKMSEFRNFLNKNGILISV